ncbi:MAG TPA: endolytic transglycosylase MltG, partial [Thioalkalivibrio sp.]|nr:endolytic transglycosylase MltG [Thioalkalivibrio sp.]
DALAAHPHVVHTDAIGDPDTLMSELGQPGMHPEGWFYPDTYHFPKGTTDVEFLRRANAIMRERLAAEWAEREEGLPLETPYEALILASIVEKESAVASERPMIAAVFVSRLRKGMRLQTDPTVIYGMGESFDGNIRKSDLRRDTPYNTYTRGGLPPTPIALPSGESIHAVMHPAKTDALYFVSRGDGSHHFSATYEEHREAVIRYLLGGKADRYQGGN